MGVGRNEPCPCGSGKKYKKCCQEKDESGKRDPAQPYIALDQRLSDEVDRYMLRRFPDEFDGSEDEYPIDFEEEQEQIPLFLEWNIYERKLDGRPAADWYLEDRGRHLAANERAWLRAQLSAWLGMWEVQSVESDKTLRMIERLTGEERLVTSAILAESAAPGETFLARMVECEGLSLIFAPHPYSLTPIEAQEVFQTIRQDLDLPKPTLPAHLREGDTPTALIDYWDRLFEEEEEGQDEEDEEELSPIPMYTTDGDPIQLVEDTYQLVGRGARAAVEATLPTLSGIQPPAPDDPSACFRLLKSNPEHPDAPPVVHASIYVRPRSILVTTASNRRADAMRSLLAETFPEIVRFKERTEEDFQRALVSGNPIAGEASVLVEGPEADAAILAFKRNYYANWHKESLPALDGLTPEEAATQSRYRGKLEALLKEMIMSESRVPPGQRYDFGEIRKRLGLA